MSCSASHGPKQPWRPNSSTNTSPEMTGETANGRSISVMSRFLPRKVELRDRPARADAEHEIGRHGDRRGEQRQPQRGEGVRILHRCEIRRRGRRQNASMKTGGQRQRQKEPEERRARSR